MAWNNTVDGKTSGELPADKGQFGQNNASEEHKPLPMPSEGEQQVNQGPPHQEYGGERS